MPSSRTEFVYGRGITFGLGGSSYGWLNDTHDMLSIRHSKGASALAQDGVIHSWDANTPKGSRPLSTPQQEPSLGPVQAMTVVPDGMRVLGLHVSGALSCWTASPATADAPASTEVIWKHMSMTQRVDGILSQVPSAAQLVWLGGKGESLAGDYKFLSLS